MNDSSRTLAVLVSGGLDSAVLLGLSLDTHDLVQPIYIRAGARWEDVELAYLMRFLDAIRRPALRSLVVLSQPVGDLYGQHWSLAGDGVPDDLSPDDAVFLPGRNVLLLVKSLIWCHLNGVPRIAMAPLAANPFPDATPSFFTAFQDIMNQAIHGRVRVEWPYLDLQKTEVIRRGSHLPLQHTFSCIQPSEGRHCGACNKCAERQSAFTAADVPDPTIYAIVKGR